MSYGIERHAAKHVRRIVAELIGHPRVARFMGRDRKQQHDHINDQVTYEISYVYFAHRITLSPSVSMRKQAVCPDARLLSLTQDCAILSVQNKTIAGEK